MYITRREGIAIFGRRREGKKPIINVLAYSKMRGSRDMHFARGKEGGDTDTQMGKIEEKRISKPCSCFEEEERQIIKS